MSKMDPALYNWTSNPTIPGLYHRRAFGPETKWAHQLPSHRQLYLTGRIKFRDGLRSMAGFSQAAEKAWVRLRFEYPEVVQRHSGQFNADGSAIMQCEIPQDEEIAESWAKQTFSIGFEPPQRGEMAPVEVEMRERQLIPDPVSVLWHATRARNDDPESLLAAEFCLRVDHGLADGVGAYILGGKYLKLVGEELGGKEYDRMEWPKGAQNIPKAWVQMLNDKQETSGPNFDNNVKANTDLVMSCMQSRRGLTLQPEEGYKPMATHHTFSPTQTTAILRSVKKTLGPAYTITHLGHAAMIMTLLKLTPNRATDQTDLVSLLFVNGRRYLNPQQPKSTDHIPLCRAMGAIQFLHVERYTLTETSSRAETQQKLKIACEEARRSYQRVKEQDSLLTESFAVAEVMATAKNQVKEKGMADPFFLNDGIAEQHTPRSYTNCAGTSEMFSLEDIRFTAVPDGPPLVIRMSTFRDTIRLSAEWNWFCYPEGVIRRFMENVVELMLSLTDDEEVRCELRT